MKSQTEKRLYFFILTFAILFLQTLPVFANEQLNQILAPYEQEGASIGVAVYNLSKRKIAYMHNPHTPLNPASTMKILTTVASLRYLSGSFVFKTYILTDEHKSNEVHNLYVRGSGDPSFATNRVLKFAENLKRQGIQKITGDIIIDNSYFQPSAPLPTSLQKHMPPNTAFALNQNRFSVVSKPVGGDIMVETDPPIDYFELTLKHQYSRKRRSPLRINRKFQDGKEHITAIVNGKRYGAYQADVIDPVLYAGAAFKWALEEKGISVEGQIREGVTLANELVTLETSQPLSKLLDPINKKSNNFYAEMLFKTLGAQIKGEPGTSEKSAQVLTEFLNKLKINPEEYHIDNGSGLSRDNRLSAYALTRVLQYAYRNKKIRQDFLPSLARAGMEGTLRRRLRSPQFKGNIRAKTGSLFDTTTLAGYFQSNSGDLMAFSILVNNPNGGGWKYYEMQEKLLFQIYTQY